MLQVKLKSLQAGFGIFITLRDMVMTLYVGCSLLGSRVWCLPHGKGRRNKGRCLAMGQITETGRILGKKSCTTAAG